MQLYKSILTSSEVKTRRLFPLCISGSHKKAGQLNVLAQTAASELLLDAGALQSMTSAVKHPATQPRILLICLKPSYSAQAKVLIEQAMAQIVESAPDAGVVVLTAGHTPFISGHQVELWPDGHLRGLGNWLTVARRIAWAQFDSVYDLTPCFRSKCLHLTVKPCPPWHKSSINQS